MTEVTRGRPNNGPLPYEPAEGGEGYAPSVNDVLRLNWKTQPLGKRAELEARLAVAKEYLEIEDTYLANVQDRIITMPITEETAEYRKEYEMSEWQYSRVADAVHTLERELARRGGSHGN